MKLLIIQTSPYHTASTFLVNAIYGLIPELFNKKIIGLWDNHFEKYFKDIIVIKSHDLLIDKVINKYNKQYKLVFICSERQKMNYLIDKKYKSYDNVVVFDFDELNETSDNKLIQIVDNIYNKVSCDGTSNFIYLDMNGFMPERYYRLELKIKDGFTEQYVNDQIYFKVVR
jgi:hypothetical protein